MSWRRNSFKMGDASRENASGASDSAPLHTSLWCVAAYTRLLRAQCRSFVSRGMH
jgi:hypothetical protein